MGTLNGKSREIADMMERRKLMFYVYRKLGGKGIKLSN